MKIENIEKYRKLSVKRVKGAVGSKTINARVSKTRFRDKKKVEIELNDLWK